ncbi:MAG: GNAT family N-acetyltransferase [Ktedonobacterales bacterium]|nr:GNAT family N-acetyltransferase [Ktedonobacterales bacterium]
MMQLPEGYQARAARLDDLEAIATVVATCQIAEYGEPDTPLEEIRMEWQVPGFDPATDAWVVVAPGGRVVAVADAWAEHGVQIFLSTRVVPDACGKGIGSYLLTRTEARAHAMAATAPDGARVTLNTSVTAVNEAGHRLLAGRGYTLVRHYWTMRVDLEAPPSAPRWPEDITLRPFVAERDAPAVFAAINEAFADHWGHLPMEYSIWEHFALHGPMFDAGLFLVAYQGDEMAGVAICGQRMGLGWVHQLGVRRPWRKRGLGRALLLHAFGECYRRSWHSVCLGVDARNLTGALRLYEQAGMRPVRQFDRFQKELRAGNELATQTLDR